MNNPRFWTLVAMILAAAATRLIPHPPNLTAVGAVALFGGAYFSRRWLAVLIPLAAMLLSDLALPYTLYAGSGLSITPMTYICFLLTVGLGMLLRERVSFGSVTIGAVAASVMFFLLSNGWVWFGGSMYPHNAAGLIECYLAGLPFAQNMLVGNLFYCGVLFGGMEACQRTWPALQQRKLATAPVVQ
nr:hypothetical protein [uncultured bacterium]